jgi:hypothetical protein
MMKTSGVMKLLAVLVCGMLSWTACSTSWISEAEQIVAILIPATANLVTLAATVDGKSISAADLQEIQNVGKQAGDDLQLMQQLITQYETVDASAQPGLLNQIQVAAGTVQASLNGLLPALHIKDAATQAKISAVMGILLSEVQSLEAMVPVVKSTSSPAMRMMAVRQAPKQLPLTANEFVKSYNATLTAKSGNASLDHATTGLRIHSHARLERWASAGRLE